MLTFEQLPEAVGAILDKMSILEKLLSTPGATPVIIEKPVSTKEICDFLSITEPTLIRWRNKGKIPFIKIGSNIRYNKAEVIKALEVKNNTK